MPANKQPIRATCLLSTRNVAHLGACVSTENGELCQERVKLCGKRRRTVSGRTGFLSPLLG